MSPDFLHRLRQCIVKWEDSDDIEKAVDGHWKGMARYWQHPNREDPWIDCSKKKFHSACNTIWLEAQREDGSSRAFLDYKGPREILAMEQCNFVSNVAYYHSAIRACEYPEWKMPLEYRKAIKRGLLTLASGSAFMHGSHTHLGALYDVNMIGMITYVAYQGLISNFDTKSPILLGLKETPQADAIKLIEDITMLPLTHDVNDWSEVIEGYSDLYPQEYYLTFAALFIIAFTVTLPEWLVTTVIKMIIGFCPDENDRHIAVDLYLPQIIDASRNLTLSVSDIFKIYGRIAGTSIKIGWAFLWQEQFSPLPSWTNEYLLKVGVPMTPWVNWWADLISGMPETDQAVTTGEHMYPGSEFCNYDSAHSFWHEQSANGFFEIVMLADTVYGTMV